MDKNENKGLKPYEAPSTRKTLVELEEGRMRRIGDDYEPATERWHQ